MKVKIKQSSRAKAHYRTIKKGPARALNAGKEFKLKSAKAGQDAFHPGSEALKKKAMPGKKKASCVKHLKTKTK